ncbi:hypothetical protein VF04_04375 [Nostoc linckia z7]|uniref:Uncharacterized protein n=2 Tax=Nostoc linckia TaxID=92942 RepID=A0A9Q6EN44_NOSLI|nr:hypothetical protein [Nostoc linckia]PHK42948.1 hypothetical protein VF12_01075 [Nostoc linckia z15]PHK48105.1 hypothetical protein VF13_02050 [Nostoc linckia z16]PHJ65025.1 hypothetical protein VF02_11860 [Nostoc linckia z1]PHJ70066.1 hypothetical protein VF05_11255 [Nostoc linckia z3]PHJ75104.1 hypothetical protein VF03_12180 [Nostoc linckia z2]
MGESKRRKQILKENYGIPNINAQVQAAWDYIALSIDKAKSDGNDCLITQCCNNNKGFHPDAIAQVKKEIEHWECDLNIPVLIQMLPQGFRPTEIKLFDGFITVWCNCPDFYFWKALFETSVD